MSGDAPARSLTVDLDAQRRHPVNLAAAVLVATSLTLLVLAAVLPNLWYRLHDISDIFVYADYAAKMAAGLRPFRDFAIEYPPLAVPLFRLPGHTDERRRLHPLVHHADGHRHDAHGGRDGGRRLQAVAGRRPRLRVGRPLRRERGPHGRHHREPLRRRGGAAHRRVPAVPVRALVHRRGVRAGARLRPQDHAGGAAAPGARAHGRPAPLAVAAGRLRRRGPRALPALPVLVAGRPVVRVRLPPLPAAADRERAGDADAHRQARRRLERHLGPQPRLALARRAGRRPRGRPLRRPHAARPGRRLRPRLAPARAPARRQAGRGSRRAGAHPGAHDLRQGAVAPVLRLDAAGRGARRRPRPAAGGARPRHAAAHADRVPGALLALPGHGAAVPERGDRPQPAARGVLRGGGCGVSGRCPRAPTTRRWRTSESDLERLDGGRPAALDVDEGGVQAHRARPRPRTAAAAR